MKLHDLSMAINGLAVEYDMDGTDIRILNAVLKMKEQGDVYTMKFIKSFLGASQATTHKRIKKLVTAGLLARPGDESNLRIKKIEPTAKTEELVKFLETI